MIVCDVQQGTDQWKEARLGIPTASNFDKLITSQGKPSTQRTKYIYQLAAERVVGQPLSNGYSNAAMERGVEMEAEARALYEIIKDVQVQTVGVCYPNEAKLMAASPDGLVGEDGLLEIKCPEVHTHVGYLIEGKLPTEYFQQVNGQLYITGRQWCDFMSYYPGLRPLIVRVYPDAAFGVALLGELGKALKEIEEITERIR